MKKRYQVFYIWEATIPGLDFDTLSEATEHCRHSMFEALFNDEMIIKNTIKDRIVRRFPWEDFNKGGKLYKPPACSKCKSEETIDIVYGYPTTKTMKKAERGEIHLGGCCITNNDPPWYCKKCQRSFGKIKLAGKGLGQRV